MTIKPELLETLRQKRQHLLQTTTPEKLEALHAKGALSARERLMTLFDQDTFQETGLYARHRAQYFGMKGRDLPTDGVITGTGYVGGKQVSSFSQDFSVLAGTLGKMHAQKIVGAMQYAAKIGVPMVAFQDSGGARIQ